MDDCDDDVRERPPPARRRVAGHRQRSLVQECLQASFAETRLVAIPVFRRQLIGCRVVKHIRGSMPWQLAMIHALADADAKVKNREPNGLYILRE